MGNAVVIKNGQARRVDPKTGSDKEKGDGEKGDVHKFIKSEYLNPCRAHFKFLGERIHARRIRG